MADPDWIGPPVEQAWWAWDGQRVQYQLKREGATIRDTWQQGIDGGSAARLDGAARADLDAAQPVLDAQRTRMAFVRNGDVFVRDLRNGALTQVTRSNDDEAHAAVEQRRQPGLPQRQRLVPAGVPARASARPRSSRPRRIPAAAAEGRRPARAPAAP